MSVLVFILASCSPLIVIGGSWYLTRRYGKLLRGGVVVLSILIGAAIGLECVWLALGIKYDPSREQNPGVGVAFLPLFLVWAITSIVVLVAFAIVCLRPRRR